MLLDKSGMRKKPKGIKIADSKKGSDKHKPLTEEQQKEAAIRMALNYGVGYNQYKEEVDAIKATKIREKLEGSHG